MTSSAKASAPPASPPPEATSDTADADAAAPTSPVAPPLPPPPPAAAIQSFKGVCLDSLAFDPVEREGKLYVVKLRPKMVVVTPPMTLASSLVDGDGEPLPFASLAPPAQLASFLRRVESAALAACLANKADWFRKDLDDDALRAGFKSFLRANGTLKVKVPDDLAAFDASKKPVAPGDVSPGAQVRGILELAKISFGKTEFGAMWKLVQLREMSVPECLIDDADENSEDDDDFL